ncbi:unnamed protein product [Allacma fusca]|uniref:Uncharacterized protein n=1 Tax=Allacma fusca TaxID=39272 RepID=A0A8J2NI80_9HEXA|nr:unnamed protein product [Allacma fusca]
MWHLFQTKLMDKKLLGITPNSETHVHYYNPNTSVPYSGANGIKAGVMLMNLKELRKFNFEARAKAIFTAYDKIIKLAFPGLVADIKCPYNFFLSHCDHETSTCYYKNTKKPEGIENICFCNPVMQEGVHILHGKSYSFTYTKSKYPFLFDTYSMFEKLDMYRDSYSAMFRVLMEKFNSRDPKPCPPLTAEMLYFRGTTYLEKLGLRRSEITSELFIPAQMHL